jgi:hypothetical protein
MSLTENTMQDSSSKTKDMRNTQPILHDNDKLKIYEFLIKIIKEYFSFSLIFLAIFGKNQSFQKMILPLFEPFTSVFGAESYIGDIF